MANESSKSPAEELHAAGFEPLKAQLQPEFDAARGTPLDSSVNGRAVGARLVQPPILREGPFQLPPDNGGTPPGPIDKK